MHSLIPNKIKSLIMVDPEYFDVEYAINPFMQDVNGSLKKVDRALARAQWADLKQVFEKLNLQVHVLAAQTGLPDMVFCANQSFPFIHPFTGKKSVILSQMRASQRKPEVTFFKTWFASHGYEVHTLSDPKLSFEANGDLIPVPGGVELWGGVGPRTDRLVYQEMKERFELQVHTLELIHPHFYHLDTCFFVVSAELCAYVKEAFTPESLQKIQRSFKCTVEIPLEEGLQFFAGNAFCPDGKNVVMEKGARVTKARLEEQGLKVIEVETSEYMKSGGSVFCMKLALPE